MKRPTTPGRDNSIVLPSFCTGGVTPSIHPLMGETKGCGSRISPRSSGGRCSTGTIETGYPTIAETLGQKKGPPKKAAPSTRTTSAQPLTATDSKGAVTSEAVATTSSVKAGSTSMPAPPTPVRKAQAAAEPLRAQKAPDAPAAVAKDCAMTYTERVMQQAATATAIKNLTDTGLCWR